MPKHPPAVTYALTSQDKQRLIQLAEDFSIPAAILDSGQLQLTVATRDCCGHGQVIMPPERGYIRLLLELCSITAQWLYFNQDEHCAITLLGQADARLARLAHLHQRWVAQGRPDRAVTQLPPA